SPVQVMYSTLSSLVVFWQSRPSFFAASRSSVGGAVARAPTGTARARKSTRAASFETGRIGFGSSRVRLPCGLPAAAGRDTSREVGRSEGRIPGPDLVDERGHAVGESRVLDLQHVLGVL